LEPVGHKHSSDLPKMAALPVFLVVIQKQRLELDARAAAEY